MSAPTTQAGTVPENVAAEEARLALKEATALAVSLFNQHYLSDEDYASGRVVWRPFEDIRGVLSQIDNMTTGMIRDATRDTETAALQAELAGAHDRIEGLLSDHAAEKYRADTAEQQLSELRAEMETVRAERDDARRRVRTANAALVDLADWLEDGCDAELPTKEIEEAVAAARSASREGVR